MTLVVRRATEADAEVVSALNADVQDLHAAAMPELFKPSGPQTFPPAMARDLLATDNIILIAEVDTAPAGYAYAQIQRIPETSFCAAWDQVHLHHLSVRPVFRRQGVATALLAAVRGCGREVGIDLVTLQVWTFNEEARAFFRRQGFTTYVERLSLR
jgi:GNAT superfamily N-acetyltransferase